MNVITAPHPTLRKVAKPVNKVDKKLLQNIKLLIDSLILEKDPEGVGLAFPQINKSISGFAYRPDKNKKKAGSVQVFFNPKIIAHSNDLVLGRKPKKPDLEGCLSVPRFFGAVPRWSWVEMEYQIVEDSKLVTHKQLFKDYKARIVQHEIDHLNGILFTDHVLKHNLPIYLVENDQLIPFEDKELLKSF